MDRPDEMWRPISAFDGYEVSDRGRIRKLGAMCHTNLDCHGYPRVCLSNGHWSGYKRVHHLVLEAFVGPRPDGFEACHGNGVRNDNRRENLRWDTRSANLRDRHAHGRGFVKHGRYAGRFAARATKRLQTTTENNAI